jgi:hypothetical protein
MLVVMQQDASERDIEKVIERMVDLGFDVHRSSGTIYTVLGGVGDTRKFEEAEFKSMSGVREAIRITSRWKLASKRVNPQGTRIRIGAVEVGGDFPGTPSSAKSGNPRKSASSPLMPTPSSSPRKPWEMSLFSGNLAAPECP